MTAGRARPQRSGRLQRSKTREVQRSRRSQPGAAALSSGSVTVCVGHAARARYGFVTGVGTSKPGAGTMLLRTSRNAHQKKNSDAIIHSTVVS